MKIAYIGNFGPRYSTENDVKKAFEFLGHEVIALQENQTPAGSLLRYKFDLLLMTSTEGYSQPLNDMLEVFHTLAKRGTPTATIHLDTFWPTSRGGRKWWLEPMFHTAHIFTADGDHQEKWAALGKNHIWLPPAVRHDAVGRGVADPKYECDVAFVGSNGIGYHEDVWTYRKELLASLREMAQRNQWKFLNPGGDHPKVERSEELNNFYASAKVVVGDSLCLNKEQARYWSDRVPETTGRGGFLIMPHIEAAVQLHKGTFVTYPWGDMQQLESSIKHWLDDSSGREAIQQKAVEVTGKHHTYVNRAETILETIYD